MASEQSSAEPVEPSRAELRNEALIAGAGILIVLGAIKHLGVFVPPIGHYAFTIAAAIQLYVPIFLIGKRGVTLKTLGFTLARWREDARAVLWLSLATIVPFAIGHHFWQTLLFHRTLTLRIPDGLLLDIVTQLLVVALAEEMYFRGYLQERLERLWPAKHRVLGVSFGAAIIVAAAVFDLAHFVGEYRLDRLGRFFPGLAFGWLRSRTGTIAGAVGYHAFCNVLGEVLWAWYHS